MKKRQIYFYIPIIIYSIVLFILSNQSTTPDFINDYFGMDKLVHAIVYSFFAILTNVGLKYKFHGMNNRLGIILAIRIVFCISDEYHQSFIIGREASVYDILFDIIGLLVGLAIIKLELIENAFRLFFENYRNRS